MCNMKHRFLFLFVLCLIVVNNMAQLRYPVVGHYQNAPAQGMAIWGDYAFLMSHGGRCRVYNLKSSKLEKTFMLASADSNNHVNNVCFGKEKVKDNDKPVLYVSECHGRYRCFVESLSDNGSELVQTIELRKSDGKSKGVLNWVVDTENDCIYAIYRYATKEMMAKSIAYNTVAKYRLPKLSEGNRVIINEKDSLDSFNVTFPNAIQGAKIRNNILYIATGYQETASFRKDSKRAIQVIDLKKKELLNPIDLTCVTMNEPEDIDFYGDQCLLYCGQTGGLFEVNIE